MNHILPELPYAMTALEPYISSETLNFHYGKHFASYVNNLNNLIKGTKFENMPLKDIILSADGGIFNNAAQAENHDFYFKGLVPAEQSKMSDTLKKVLEDNFGSVEKFKEDMNKVAASQFGSGWAWLVADSDNRLKVMSTGNAGNPMTEGLRPLLTIDVWEHVYYIDYRNARPSYLDKIWNIINWDIVEQRLNNR